MFSSLPLECFGFLSGARLKPEVGVQFLHHAARAQVAGHEDKGSLKVHQVVISQTERGFVQDAQQQARQGGGRLFNFIKRTMDMFEYSLATEDSLAWVRMG
jgi:hypothetical protein